VNQAPLRIEPVFSPRIWGARSLAPWFPDKTNLAEPLGEAWLTGLDCRLVSWPFRGKSLGEAWQEMPAEWRGTQFAADAGFPLLVKFIFPTAKLSIQVHPDDAFASAHEQAAGGRGKTEMWHIVSAEPNAQVLLGLKAGVGKQEFLAALEQHTLESLFQAHSVLGGDTIFVPAGSPHTIGRGMVVLEVQQYSDLTYRVYDYGRLDSTGKPRELHLDKALAVTKFGGTAAGRTSRIQLPTEEGDRWLLAACPYFATERREAMNPFTVEMDPGHFDLLVALFGEGLLRTHDFAFPFAPGECWFLPANLGEYQVQPIQGQATVIRTYVPNLAALRDEIHRAGQAKAADRTVFDGSTERADGHR
jgi:mannose-6-phosphate isomerase